MKITIVGAHGQISMLLHPILVENGHSVRGIIRKEEQAEDLKDLGVEPVVADIEQLDDISDDACLNNGIDRYVIISAMGLDSPRGSEVFKIYQTAKAEADEAVRNSRLNYTIVKPGRLTDEPGTGKVSVGTDLERGEIPRKDVAAVLAEVFELPGTIGLELDLVSGEKSISEALTELVQKKA